MSKKLKKLTKSIQNSFRRNSISESSSRTLKAKLMLSVAAIGSFFMPWGGQEVYAGEITRVGQTNNLIGTGKADIYAEAVNTANTVGLNRFSQFKVDANEIANLHFKQENGTTILNSLINTVQNPINIAGTVNAIRNNQIGGNLFFLSPGGMVITGSGAINAGSLTVMTPTEDFFTKAGFNVKETIVKDEKGQEVKNYSLETFNLFTDNDSDKIKGFMKLNADSIIKGNVASLPDPTKNELKDVAIALNKSGSIAVHGQINAQTAMKLAAGQSIYINKDTNGAAPILRTGLVFDNVVNTAGKFVSASVKEGERMQIATDSSGNLVLRDASNNGTNDITGDGSINIKAYADSTNFSGYDPTIHFLSLNDTAAKATVNIGEGAEINALGKASISSEAKYDKTINATLNFFNNMNVNILRSDTFSDTVVDGKVSGAQVDITSKASSTTNLSNESDVINLFRYKLEQVVLDQLIGTAKTNLLKNILSNQIRATIGNSTSEATTKLGENASVEAHKITGVNNSGDVNISADSSANYKVNITMHPFEDTASLSSKSIFNAGFLLSDVTSKAIVDIAKNKNLENSITAEKDLNITSNATNKMTSALKVGAGDYISKILGDKSYSFLNFGIGITNQTTESTINMGTNVKAEGSANVAAKESVSLGTSAGTSNKPTGALSSGILIVNSDNTVKNNISGNITANSVKVSSDLKIDKLQAISSDTVGAYNGLKTKLETYLISKIPFKDEIAGVAQGIFESTIADGKLADIIKSTEGLAKLFSAGASVLTVGMDNTVETNIKEDSIITANSGDLNVLANADITSSRFHVKSAGNDIGDKRAAVFVAVGVNNIKNNVSVNVEKNAQLKATKGNVNIKAFDDNHFDNLNKAVTDVFDLLKEFDTYYNVMMASDSPLAPDEKARLKNLYEEAYTSTGEITADLLLVPWKGGEKYEAYLNYMKDMAAKYEVKKFSWKGITESILAAISDGLQVWEHLDFTTFFVYADARQKDESKMAGFGLTGAVGVHNVENISSVNIGENVKITAQGQDDKGNVNISANTLAGEFAFGGRFELLPCFSDGSKVGMGGTAVISDLVTNSTVKINDGVQIDASKVITIETDNEAIHQMGGTAGNNGKDFALTGLVTKLGGSSKGTVEISDQTIFSAGDAIKLKSNNKNILTNLVGEKVGSGSASVGASVSQIAYDIDSIVTVGTVNNLNTALTNNSFGTWTANVLDVNAINSGVINTLAIAGVSSEDPKQEDPNKPGLIKTLWNKIVGPKQVDAEEMIEEGELQPLLPEWDDPGAGGDAEEGHGEEENANINQQQQNNSKIKVSLAGSVAYNNIKENTKAEVHNITLNKPTSATKDNSHVNITADDSLFIGAYSGSGALTRSGTEADSNKFSATLAGAVALNEVDKTTKALVDNATITTAGDFTNKGYNHGTQLAAGVGLGIEQGNRSGGAGFDFTASGSQNEVINTISAELNKATITSNASIGNIAYANDTQIAGGISFDYAKTSLGLGATVTVQDVSNQIEAKISGGKLQADAGISNLAADKLLQVGGAVSIGVTPKTDSKTYISGNAAVSVNRVINHTKSIVDGGASLTAGKISLEAYDKELDAETLKLIPVADDQTLTEKAEAADIENENQETAEENNSEAPKVIFKLNSSNEEEINKLKDLKDTKGSKVFDLTGQGFEEAAKNGGDISLSIDDAQEERTYKDGGSFGIQNNGSRIIGGALSLSANMGDTSGATFGAGLTYNDVINSFTSTVSGANLTITDANQSLDVKAMSDTLVVGGALGVAAKSGEAIKGFSLAGSGAISRSVATTKATIENSTVKSDTVNVNALTKSVLISAAGQGTGTNADAALGLTWAQNKLENTTGAYIYGGTLDGYAHDLTLNLLAENQSKNYAIAAGVGASIGSGGFKATATGAYAANTGRNNTEAIIDGYKDSEGKLTKATLGKDKKAQAINVNAQDKTTLKAISGAINVAAGSASTALTFGGTVVNNKVGNENKKQNVLAQINNASIKTTDAGNVNIKADNQAELLSVAVGGALAASSGFSLGATGSVAIDNIHTLTDASMTDTDINSDSTKAGNVNLDAISHTNVTISADDLNISASTGGVPITAMGVVSKVNSDADTSAGIYGTNKKSTQNVKKEIVKADSKNNITDVAIGVNISGSSGSLAPEIMGNIAANNINNDTKAEVKNANITADDLGVLAVSEENIKNYGGSIGVSGSNVSAASFGATVVLNKITGETTSLVDSSIIKTSGGEGIGIKKYALDSDEATEEKVKGLVVNADAKHNLRDITLTLGVAGSPNASFSVNATVAENTIAGGTKAQVLSSTVDSGAADLSIRSHDLTNVNSFVGTLSVGASTVGFDAAGSGDHNDFSRKVIAEFDGGATVKNLQAKAIDINSLNKAKLTLMESGLGISGGQVAIGVTGVVSVDDFNGETYAVLNHGDVTSTNSVSVEADSKKDIGIYTNAASVSGGYVAGKLTTAVGVIKESSQTFAKIENSLINTKKDSGSPEVNLKANNKNEIITEAAEVGLAIGLGGAVGTTISVNNFRNAVSTKLINSQLGSENNSLQKFTSLATNTVHDTFSNNSVSGGLASVGVGVGVNTIDTGVLNKIENSKVCADSIDVKAEELRDIQELAINAGIGAGSILTSVMVNNIGATIEDEYKDPDNSIANYNLNKIQEKTKEAYQEVGLTNNKLAEGKFTKGVSSSKSYKYDKGGNAEGVQTKLTGSHLVATGTGAGDELNIKSLATTNTDVKVGQGLIAAGNYNVTVASTTIHQKTGVDIDKSILEANKINIQSENAGELIQKAIHANVSGGSINVVVSTLENNGSNKISIYDRSTITAGRKLANKNDTINSSLNIEALDNLSMNNYTTGVEVGGSNTGALFTRSYDYVNTGVDISGGVTLANKNTLVEENIYKTEDKRKTLVNGEEVNDGTEPAEDYKYETDKPVYGAVKVAASNKNVVQAKTNVVQVGLLNANGAVSTARVGDGKDKGITSVNVTGANNFKGSKVELGASNQATAKADVFTVNVALADVSCATATAENNSQAKTLVSGQNFVADEVNLAAYTSAIGTFDRNAGIFNIKTHSAEATVEGGTGSLNMQLGINTAKAISNNKSELTVENNSFKKSTWADTKAEDVLTDDKKQIQEIDVTTAHEEFVEGKTKLSLENFNVGTEKVDSKVVDVTIGVGLGSNQAITENKSKTTLKFKPGTYKGENLSIEAYNADYSKNTADGNGGSYFDVSPLAAKAKHTNESETTVNISGEINTSGDVSVVGANYVQSEMYADAIRAKIAGGSGVTVDNIINNKATVELQDAKIKADGSVSVGTYNTVVFNKENDKAVLGNGYGAGDTTCGYVNNDITTTANTNLLGSTSIISNGEQNYYADTDTDIKSEIYVLSGALAPNSSVTNELQLTSNNTVKLANAAKLATKDEASDITLAANDQHKLVIASLAESIGAVNFATVAKNYNTVNRNNTINVEGNISSLHDVNLFAGKGINGELGLMDLYSTAEAYSKSAIPVSGAQPHIYNEFNQTNTVNVKTEGEVTAVRNANLYADAGKEITELFCRTFTKWGSKGESEYVSTTNGKISYNEKAGSVKGKTAHNTVQIDGSVTAGAANYQNYHLGFKDRTDMVVLTSQEQYDAVIAYLNKHPEAIDDRAKYILLVEDDKKGQEDYYRTIDEIISITDKDGQPVEGLQITAKDFKVGARDYGISILSRMNELDKLLDSYGDDQTSAAYQGYKAEYDNLYQRLKDAGCITTDGEFKSIVVNYVEVPDLVARGGNVNVTTDNFYSSEGQGKVTAKGTPSINIVNDTNLAMNINDISVADAGGQIFYNEKALNPGTDTSVEKINKALAEEIRQANKDHSKTISKAYAATGSAGTINIKGNNQLSKYDIYYKYVDIDGNTQVVEDNQAVKADIFINGTVSAPDGTIKIESAKNDIIIEGKSAGDNNALVTAKTVNLIAGNGSVNQGYVDNIVNIGGDPRNLYDEVDKKTLKPNEVNKISSTVSVGQGATVAGGNVVINAADINVNGTIQSGYEKFFVDIKPGDELNKSDFDPSQTGTITVDERMKEIAEYNAGKGVTDSNVVGNPAYLLIKGMAVKRTDESNVYDYRVEVYYNPATNRIIVGDVESKGGRVYLTGNIASTGGGQINCLDGASDISVKNSIDKELVVGNLITNDVTGIIHITDTNQLVEVGDRKVAKVSEYSRDDAGDVWVSYNGGEKTKLTGAEITYAPKEGIRYSWTEGTTTSTKKTYRKTWYNKWWGASSTQSGFRQDLIDNSSESTQIGGPYELGSDPKAQGEFIGLAQGNLKPDKEDIFDVVYERTNTGKAEVGNTTTRQWSQGYLNCHKYTEITWDVTESGIVDTYTYSVKADQPFKLNFIGKADGVSQVDVSTSKNNILLTGDIGNRNLYEVKDVSEQITGYDEKGSVNLRADLGSIKRVGGSIYGNDVDVLAMGNVEDLDVTAGDNMNLAVKNISAIIDGDASIRPTSEVEQNISVTAHSNGLAAGNLTISKAGTVDLEYGTSGTGEVKITETQTANTNVIDLVNKGRVGNITTTSDGLIAASRINLTSENGSINANVRAATEAINTDPLSASVNANAQGNITLTQKKLASDASDSNYDLRIGTIYSTAGDVTINVPDGSVIDALPYEDLSQATKNTLIEKWLANGLIDDPEASAEAQAKSKALQEEKTAALKKDKNDALSKTYTPWSKEALLYSIQNSIINQKSEDLPKTSLKAPNVRGNNITLNVKDSAGLLDENVIQMKVSTLGDANKESINKGTGLDDLKLLSQTDPSNVVWDSQADRITITKKLPIGVQLNSPGQDEEGKILPLGLIKVANFTEATPQVEGNIFLEGRIDPKAEAGSDLNKDLKIGKLSAAGDISVTSLGKILGLENTEDAYIIGKSLNITAADGSIGEKNNPLLTDIFGGEDSLGLRAIAPSGIYIKDVGSYDEAQDNALWLNRISSAGDIEISADKSIYQLTNASDIPYNIENEKPDTKLTLVSYKGSVGQAITNEDGSIKYDEEGFPILTTYEEEVEGKKIKKQSKAIHVKNGASNVTIKAAKNIYVEGITSAEAGSEPQGTLNLNAGNVDPAKNLQNFGVYVNGSLNLADETSNKVSAENLISLDTAKALSLNKELEAKDVKLRSKENVTTNAVINATNDVLVLGGMDVAVNEAVSADRDVNIKANNNIVSSDKGLISAGNDVNLTAINESMELAGKVTAGNDANLTSGQAMQVNEVKATNGSANLNAGTSLTNTGVISAGKDASLTATTTIVTNGQVKAGNDAKINAGTELTINAAVNAKNDAILTAGTDLLANSDVKAKNAKLTAENDVNVSGKVEADESAELDAGHDALVSGDVKAKNAKLTATNDVKLSGSVAADENAELKAGHDILVLSTGDIAAGNAKLSAENDINVSGKVQADETAELTAKHDALVSGEVKAKNAKLSAENDVNVSGKVQATETAELNAKENVIVSGSVIGNDKVNIISANKNISLTSVDALVQGANINLAAKENITEVYDNAQNIGASIVTNYVEDGVTKQGTLTTNNNGALDLGSKNNKLGIVSINNTSSDAEGIIKLGNSGSKDLEVTVKNETASDKKVAGSVEIFNYDTGLEQNYNNVYVNEIYAQGDLSITNAESYDEDSTAHYGIYIGRIPEYHAGTEYKEYPGVIDVGGQIDLIAKGTVNNEQLGKDKSSNPVAGGSITAGKDINIKAQVFSNGEGAQIISKSGSLNAEITGADIEKVKFAEVERAYLPAYNRGSIITEKDINITTTNEKGSIANFGILQAGNENSEGSVNLKSNNNLYMIEIRGSEIGKDDSNVWAAKEINIDVKNNMLEYGSLWADGGDININVGKDAIISGDLDTATLTGNRIEAEGNVNITIGKDIINQNVIVADEGNIDIRADGSVLNSKHGDKYVVGYKENPVLVKDVINDALKALGFDYKLEDDETSNGILDARNGQVYVLAGASEKDYAVVVNNSTIYAKDNIYVSSLTGDVANGGDFLVNTGDITINAAKRIANLGNMKVGGTGTVAQATSGDVNMIAGEDLVNYGVVESPEGDILLTVTNDGIIYNAEQADFLTKGNIIILNQTKDQDKLYRFDIDLPEDPTLMELYEAKKVKSETGEYLNGSVINQGDLLANQGTIRIKSNAADVYNYDDFDTFNRKDHLEDYLHEYNGIVISTGSIELLAPKGEVLNTKDLIATGDPTSEKFNAYVLIEADKDLANYAYNILADKDITLISHSGNIVNSAVLQSTSGDVTLIAENGSVANTRKGWDDETSRKNENGGDIIALNGQVHLLAGGAGDQEKITVEGKEYKSGSVINNGDLVSLGENGLIHLNSEHGDVINTTDLRKLYNAKGEEIGNIYEALAGTNAGKGGAIDPNYDKAINGYLISTNDITLKAPEGAIYNSKELLVALGNVTMEAAEGMDSFGDTIYAGKNINLTANKGDLVNNAKLISIEGNINLTSKEGSVVNMLNADIEALGTGEDKGNVNLNAGGNTTEGKDLSVKFVDTKGNKGKIVKVTVDPETHEETREEVNFGNILVAHKFYKSDATGEYVQVDDTTNISGLSSAEQASLVTVFGFISDNGEVIYSEDYKAEDAQGQLLPPATITYMGQTLTGVQKDIEAYRTGDVVNRGDIIAQGSKGVQLVSEHSNVANYDNFSIIDGLVNEKGERYYEENIADKFNSGTKYSDEKYNKGIISVGDIALHADEGYIYNNMDIITEGNVDITSEKALTSGLNFGRIEAGKNVNISSKENINLIGKASPEEIVNILSKDGIVSIASENGNVHGENFTIEANSKATEPSPNGSIALTSTYGNINFVNSNLFANGNADGKGGTITAAVGVGAEGTPAKPQSIILGEIGSGKELKGNQIIVLNENILSDSEIKLGDITVNNFLVIEGQQAEVGKISREKQDVFDPLHVAVTGAQGGTMQGSINLETSGNTRYHALNVTDANVSTTDGGKLEIDKLHTAGKVQVESLGFTTSIYGKTPDADDNSATIYFDLTDGSGVGFDLEGKEGLAFSRESRYSVVDALTDSLLKNASTSITEARNPGSFYLNTFAPDYQESNGLLLHRAPYYYVKNQRFSLEDLTRKLDETADYTNRVGEIHLYDRYNLYELADGFVEGLYDSLYTEGEGQEQSSEKNLKKSK